VGPHLHNEHIVPRELDTRPWKKARDVGLLGNTTANNNARRASVMKKAIVTTSINKQETNLTVKKIYDPENPNADPEITPDLIVGIPNA
jgi:flagellar basal body rod protein FlgC